jgi:alpha-L-fucosidase
MRRFSILLSSLLLASLTGCQATDTLVTEPAKVDMAKRTKELQDLRFGMFICWSFSTFSGKEWTPGVKDVSFFKATECDTDQWARTAKEAGMGYILFLTKHHDGFCLWNTKTTDRKVTNAPLGRDVLAELRKSCDKYGIKLALYFSEGEWRHPGGLDHPDTTGQKTANQGGRDPELKKAQLKELLTQYGPIEYIWFDHAVGTGGLSHEDTLKFCKSLQPGCFIGFNHGDQQGCDIRLGEMGKPGPLTDNSGAGYNKGVPSKDYRLAEFTYPIQPKHKGGAMWFYSLPEHDNLCMSAEDIYKDYLGAKKYGNVFALDVGPDYAGKIRKIDVETLRKVGEMIRNNASMPETPAAKATQAMPRDAKLKWFDEAKYGLFINWGLYSIPAGEWKGKKYDGIGEWIMHKAKIPVKEYQELAKQFNPQTFNAEEWAQLAEDAGMKYLVFDCKHHDGFALYKSEVSKYNCYDATPWKRDPFKELQEACKKRNIKLCFYYSQAIDWNEPNGAMNDWDFKPDKEKDFDQYLRDKSMPQVTELLKNYGPIGLIWFDYPVLMTPERSKKLAALVRSIQPDVLINSRLGEGNYHDYRSMGDNEIPNMAVEGAWETAATVNDTWGYKKDDHNWKQPDNITFKLVDIVSKGGNYLLNVGPDGDGFIPQPSQDILRKVGKWLKVNGEAVYGAGSSPFGYEFGKEDPVKKNKRGRPIFNQGTDWRCTVKPMDWTWGKAGKLYIHLFKWPGAKLELAGFNGKVEKAYMLADPDRKALKCSVSDGKLTVELPEKATDGIDSVLCIEVKN